MEGPGVDSSDQITIHTTPIQDAMILAKIHALQHDGGTFRLYSKNCATVAGNILQTSGVPNIPTTIYPNSLIYQLRHPEIIMTEPR